MTPTRLLIASGADRNYFPLLRDSVLSIRALRRDVAIGVLYLGLDQEHRDWLSTRVAHLVRPDWDLDFPYRERTTETLKAQVARPFLRRHFPGYEMYLWIDADAWLQDGRVIDLYMSAAGHHKLAITPMVNCGVFALHHDAPHWDAWARLLSQVLQRTRFFFVEQVALNYAIFAEHLPVNFLPAYCNWMPGDAIPAFDPGGSRFVEPYAPHEVIGIMHLAGREQKTHVFRLNRLDGGTVETSLRYSESRALCGRSLGSDVV